MPQFAFRDVTPADVPFLLEMLRYAVGWRTPPPADGTPLPVQVSRYALGGFGRPGDGGLVASYDAEPAGACWWRVLPASAPGFGFVAADVPELSIALIPMFRAQGLGGQLLDRALDRARADGFESISLSVERDNPARGMYERRGFEPVSETGGSLTMLKSLTPP